MTSITLRIPVDVVESLKLLAELKARGVPESMLEEAQRAAA